MAAFRGMSCFNVSFEKVIDVKTFELFWEWYGKCLQALRYQRHIGSLWNSGLLLGFVSREDVDNALRGRDPGVFLLRFSERHAGERTPRSRCLLF